jgi:hypothetical protein
MLITANIFNIFSTPAALLTENNLYFILLVVAALLLGMYLKFSSRNKKDSRADRLLKKYQVIDREDLDNIPDDDLIDAVIANLISKLDKKNPDDYSVIPLLSQGRCAIYSIWLTCNQLNSNGMVGFLSSKSGRFAELAVDGFEFIGAHQSSKAMREALNTQPEDTENLSLSELKLKNAILNEDPLKLCIEYIRLNPEEFLDK